MCHAEWCSLDRKVREYRIRWEADQLVLRRDPEFLRNWLAVLEKMTGYNSRTDHANITMLRKLVALQAE